MDANQDAALNTAIDNLKKASRMIRETMEELSLAGMGEKPENYDLLKRLVAAQAMTEAARVDAQRRLSEASNHLAD